MNKQSGFTLVELMAGVAVVGILAAVVAPSFRAHADQSKASEAKLELERLAHNATVYFQEHRKFPAGTAAVLPGDDGEACKEASKQFGVSTAWSSDSIWSALDFQVEQAARFSYHFETTSNKSARAWAVADPACTGARRVYLVVLEGRASGRVEWVMVDPDKPEPELPQVEADGEDIDGDNAGTPEAPTHPENDTDDGTGGGTGLGLGSGDGTGTGGTGGGANALDGTDNNTSNGGSTDGGSTGGGATDSSGGAVGGDSYSGNGNGTGGNGGGNTGGTNSCGSGTTIVTCPSGYSLNLANCTCKKSK